MTEPLQVFCGQALTRHHAGMLAPRALETSRSLHDADWCYGKPEAARSVRLGAQSFNGGLAYGATAEFGFKAVDGRVSIHELPATLLHQLGIDHSQLTYRCAGRDSG